MDDISTYDNWSKFRNSLWNIKFHQELFESYVKAYKIYDLHNFQTFN